MASTSFPVFCVFVPVSALLGYGVLASFCVCVRLCVCVCVCVKPHPTRSSAVPDTSALSLFALIEDMIAAGRAAWDCMYATMASSASAPVTHPHTHT